MYVSDGRWQGWPHCWMQVVSLLPNLGQKGQPEVELQVYQLAESLLQQEVDALTDVDSCCMPTGGGSSSPRPALTTTTTGATLPALGSATSDGSVSGHGARQDVLRGRLEVVRALIQALDRAGEGSNTHQDMVRLLLRSYLFPQTGVLAQNKELDRALPNLVVSAQASQTCSKESHHSNGGPSEALLEREGLTSKRASFALGCSTTMTAGFDTLSKLHFTEGMGPMPKQPAKAGAGGAPLEALRPTHGYVGLRNGGATCYMNSVLQQLFMQPRIRALVLACVPAPPEETPNSVFAQLQAMFAHLALGRAAYFNPICFWDSFRDYDGEPINIREHQDAYEFFTRLQGELMEGENAWLCEEVGRRMAATKRTCIKQLPHTLAIHLKRFEYDHINMQRFKVRDRFEFPTTLDMYKYTAEGLAAMEGSSAQALLQSSSNSDGSGVEAGPGAAAAAGAALGMGSPPSEGGWFRFDDRCVTPWDPSCLEAECFGGGGSEDTERPNSAYMLFYDRKMRLYRDVLVSNLNLAHRAHTFDRMYAGFVRNVAEQRHDRAAGDAQATRLAAAFIGNVLLQAPSALKNSELLAWDDLLASLLTSSHTALCTFVRELLHPGLQNVVMNFLVGAGTLSPLPWLSAQLRRVQAQLIAASNQVLPRDLPEGTDVEPFLTMEPMSTHQHMLAWAWQHIFQLYSQLTQARTAFAQCKRNRSNTLPNFMIFNLANPMPCTAQPFLLLADAIALDALLLAPIPFFPVLIYSAVAIAECLYAGYRDTNEDDMLDNLSAIVAALFQSLLRCPQMELYLPVLLPNGHIRQPSLNMALGRAWAAQVAEETELQCCTRDDPGPPHLLVLPIEPEQRPLSRLVATPKGEENPLVLALMTSVEMLAEASNTHMLRLMCWDNMPISRQVLVRYINLLAQTLQEAAETSCDLASTLNMLSKIVMVAGERNPAPAPAMFEGRDRTCVDTFVLLMYAWGHSGSLLTTLTRLRNLEQSVLKDSTPRTLRPFRRLTELVDIIYPICASGATLAQQQQQQEEEPEPVGYVPMDDGMSDGDLDQADQMSAEDGEDEIEEGSEGGGQTGTPPAPL
ncbi:hypothetical protein DUNSADRAFT_8393 [Dunaliella salina]|uniref:USP domain-containing protein n=1 Tax=Dunaliella salina TaxID=3046 RepID=A0ABQ7GJN5_DUNSA|nr:hypothetical protein DUNSADRAFT_8393 [Dunaliella salina]|eukprot:KAF5834809.1 hypothetical protein DUNSADRAFT_8393 [Dunaliella salina]